MEAPTKAMKSGTGYMTKDNVIRELKLQQQKDELMIRNLFEVLTQLMIRQIRV